MTHIFTPDFLRQLVRQVPQMLSRVAVLFPSDTLLYGNLRVSKPGTTHCSAREPEGA